MGSDITVQMLLSVLVELVVKILHTGCQIVYVVKKLVKQWPSCHVVKSLVYNQDVRSCCDVIHVVKYVVIILCEC